MKLKLTEAYLGDQVVIDTLKNLGYKYIEGNKLTPENNKRDSYRQVILKNKFLQALTKINTWLDIDTAKEVYKKVSNISHPNFVHRSKTFYDFLINGVKVYNKKENKYRRVRLLDFENIENNDFLVVNQFTVEYEKENGRYRRPDIVVFINGIPLAIFELKSPNSLQTVKDAYKDHKIKIRDIPQLYVYAQVLVVSDGLITKYGSTTSNWERFFVWEGIESDNDVEIKHIKDDFYKYTYKGQQITSLQLLLQGLFHKERFTEYLQDFIFFLERGGSYTKMIAMYHQFYAVRKAVERTKHYVLRGKKPEEKRIGVVWHTQGSGKSFTMLLYARKTLKTPELKNPLLIFITDRKDLDEQLYGLFSQLNIAKRVETIKELQETIKNTVGGIIFTTIQKFGKDKETKDYPFLSDRENIIVIADEAHRSQYKELAQNLRKALPNASFIGFTATPIELKDRDTYLVFGEPISIYSIEKAQRHKVVVPIYYEPRLVELKLTNELIDLEFEELIEPLDEEQKENLKRKFARLETLILNPDRLKKIAKDIVEHFNKRNQTIEGKAMVVTISRKAAVALYEEMRKLPDVPSLAVVITGDKRRDPPEFHQHIRNEKELEQLLADFKNPDKDPKMVIVVDMLLTGFDVPCLHTMYFDKPMKGASLMQAIARVNRVFKDKPGGVIVDYIGIAEQLKKSLKIYSGENKKETPNIETLIPLLKEKHQQIANKFSGIDYSNWQKLKPNELSNLITKAYNQLSMEQDKTEFLKNFVALKKLYVLAATHPEAIKIRNDIKFFEAIKKMIVRYSVYRQKEIAQILEKDITQLLSKSITAEEPRDIFAMLKKEKPDLSLLDETFLLQIKQIEHKNYAAEILMKVLNDEIKIRAVKNAVRYKSLEEQLMELIEKYNLKTLNISEILEKLIEIARDLKKNMNAAKKLNLTEEELVFYDILTSELKIKEHSELIKTIAKTIAERISPYVKVLDWNKKKKTKSQIRAIIKEELNKLKFHESITIKYTKKDKLTKELMKAMEKIYNFNLINRQSFMEYNIFY